MDLHLVDCMFTTPILSLHLACISTKTRCILNIYETAHQWQALLEAVEAVYNDINSYIMAIDIIVISFHNLQGSLSFLGCLIDI